MSDWVSVVSLLPLWLSGPSVTGLVMLRRTCPAYPGSAVGGTEELRLAARGWLVHPAAPRSACV